MINDKQLSFFDKPIDTLGIKFKVSLKDRYHQIQGESKKRKNIYTRGMVKQKPSINKEKEKEIKKMALKEKMLLNRIRVDP